MAESSNGLDFGLKKPRPRSVYVHVPFCRHRCGYCNFSLVAGRDYLVDRFLIALGQEIESLPESFEVDTVYLGGGTPTHLSDQQLAELFAHLRKRFSWPETAEVTIEANPVDLQRDRSTVFREFGINRVSLGAQSFNPSKLAVLERDHDAEQIRKAVEESRKFATSVSIDMIFATPKETLTEWVQDLENLETLSIEHVSTYELTYEKRTRFWARRLKGEQVESDEELRLQMYETTMERLQKFGFAQYEISSFARLDRRSRHNQVYWSGLDYWAFGPGASGYVAGMRYTNVGSLLRYLKLMEMNSTPRELEERLSPAESARELLAIGLRNLDGPSESEFHSRTGMSFKDCAGHAIERLTNWGLLEFSEPRLRLTNRGKLLYDTVAVEILAEKVAGKTTQRDI
ncbi:MAG: radical SAM family heme chaperone HemW [Pirellulaceae bacterium]